MSEQSDKDRLDRIEVKLDKLSEAIVSLARMEERLSSFLVRMNNYEDKQERLSSRVYDIEKLNHSRSPVFRFAERAFWVVASSGVATLFWFLR